MRKRAAAGKQPGMTGTYVYLHIHIYIHTQIYVYVHIYGSMRNPLCKWEGSYRLCASISAPFNLIPKTMKASLRLEKSLKLASGAKRP